MKRIAGREMRDLIYAVTAMTLALVLGVIAYFMVDVIMTTNENIEENKKLVVNKSVMALKDVGDAVSGVSTDPGFIQILNQEWLQEILGNDSEALYRLVLTFAMGVNPLEYAGVLAEGRLVDFRTSPGVELDPSQLPSRPAEGEFVIMENLGDRKGVFVSVFYPIDLGAFGFETFDLNMVIDRTEEMREVEGFFTTQRDDLILRMAVVAGAALLLSLLITTIGLRHFTRKYVMDPLERLNRMAEEIADGTFDGAVEVDRNSAYAALQGLLRSGQLMLARMYGEGADPEETG